VYWNFPTVTSWLYDQMFQCVLDAIEQQVISGTGAGENMLGILATSGTTDIAFTTDVPTTLRSAVSAMQNLGEVPTAWCLNPKDAQAIDLTRWGASGGFLSGGFEHDTGNGFGTSANVFGPDSIARVVTPHVPSGTALLADFDQLQLVFQTYMRMDIDAYSGFDKNAIRFRAESFVGIGILRPQAFAVISLGMGTAATKPTAKK
jgi:HK97 family phage major capsid protein